jgi:predicted nucleic acid-binding Zn ribbon protein
VADRRRSGDGPIPLSASIAQVAGRLTRADLLGLAAIKEHWVAIVGDQVAAHASPIRLTGGVLTVSVDQPAWATQLRLQSGRLRESLAAHGVSQITKIEVVVRPS